MKNSATKIKILKNQLSRIREDIDILKRNLIKLLEKSREIERDIAIQESGEVLKVTDHALLRYIERVQNFDVESVRRSIITPELQEMAKLLGGNGDYVLLEMKLKLVMKNYTIITIVDLNHE